MKSIQSYQNPSLLARYIKEENVNNDTANVHFTALKKFLKLSAQTAKPCFPSKDIDEIWHNFILFTKDYQFFCDNYLQQFIHHIPFANSDDKVNHFEPGYYCYIKDNQFKRKYVRTLAALEKKVKAECGSGGDCSSCGKCSKC